MFWSSFTAIWTFASTVEWLATFHPLHTVGVLRSTQQTLWHCAASCHRKGWLYALLICQSLRFCSDPNHFCLQYPFVSRLQNGSLPWETKAAASGQGLVQ